MTQASDFEELRSEEVQELLSQPPRWLWRWGVTIIFLMLLIIFVAAWVIHYPDLVQASFRLTATESPKAVVTRTEGKIVRLFVEEGQQVTAGAPLAYIESTAHHEEVQKLLLELRAAWTIAQLGKLENLKQLNLTTYHHLGELQSAYQIFEQTHIELRAYLSGGFYSKKKIILQQELADLQLLAQQLVQQHSIQARDAILAKEEYDVQQRLAAQKVIPALELKREESRYIARQLTYKQSEISVTNNISVQRAKQEEILELDKEVAEERDKFLQALNTLQSAVEAWQARYVLVAPVSGRVYFAGIVQSNQTVATNQEICYVAPPHTSYLGQLYIPQRSAGKVQVGQTVIIKFAGFPYQEFGIVQGKIIAIADISFRDSVYLARVSLPNGLKTTYGRSLVYKNGMTASAEVMTSDTRLLEKLFFGFHEFEKNK
jgi:HlyD family secretion protein